MGLRYSYCLSLTEQPFNSLVAVKLVMMKMDYAASAQPRQPMLLLSVTIMEIISRKFTFGTGAHVMIVVDS